MGGSGWAYSWRALLWGAAVLLSLGLTLPWAQAELERYKMRHTFYGELQGSFVGRGWDFFKRGGWVWLIGLVVVLAPFVLARALVVTEGAGQKPHPGAFAAFGFGALGMAFIAVFLYGA
jgi:uncharacterized membrane protein YjgN (DUF898 family)